MISHAEFIYECDAQGVQLYGGLGEPWLTVRQAGNAINDLLEHGAQLSSGPIPDERFCMDAVTRAHAVIINSSHLPLPSPELKTGPSFHPIAGCTKAEGFFGDWLEGLADGQAVGGSIVVDSRGEAVAINKTTDLKRHDTQFGEPSSLLLQDVVTETHGRAVTLPQGALVYTDVPLTPEQIILARQNTTLALPFSQVRGVSFARMTGVSLATGDWQQYYRGKVARHRLLRAHTIGRVVGQALQKPYLQEQIGIS